MKIRILSIDFSKTFQQDQIIDSVKGEKNYTLFIFKSDALVKTEIGLTDVSAGDCLLLSPNFPHYLRAKKGEWSFDAISFKGSDASRLVSQIGIDTNAILKPHQIFFTDAIFEKLAKEVRATDLHWERMVYCLVDELLSKIVRFAKQDFVLSMPDHSQKLRELRTEVHESFSKPWTIGQMASKMGLSASRFASLYKQEFSTSPTEDLIRTRIDQAKKMLSTTKVSVKQVSLACGFESVHYFHRAFKRRNNITPKHYQNHQLSMKGSIPASEKTFSLDGLSLENDFSGTMEVIDGEIVFHGSNSSWSEFLGYDAIELKSKPFLNFVSPKDINIAQETINNIVEGRNVKNISVNLVKKDGDHAQIEFSAMSKGNMWFWFAKKSLVLV